MAERKVRLALIGTNGIPANYGGAETLYENLTRELSDRYDITVYCSNRQPRDKVGNSYLGAKLKYWPMSANGWQSIPYDTLSMFHALFHSDVMYVFGFGPGTIAWLFRLFGCRKKIIFNHGGLNEWERESNPWIGRMRGKMHRRMLRDKVIHVTDNALQVQSLESTFNITKDVHVIRYGGDHCSPVPVSEELLAKYPFLSTEYFVSVGRAQVDNNLHIILDAFSKMPDKTLVLVSNFKSSQYGRDLYEQYKDNPNMVLIPGVYDKVELNAIRSNALAYVHTHSRCGTPPSLCEALYLGLPVISFDAPVNHEVTNDFAFFFDSSEKLCEIVGTKTRDDYDSIKEKSSDFAHRNYTWNHIAQQYANIFG